MFSVMLALVAVAVLAVFVYLIRERMGLEGLGLAALRTAGLGALVVLFANPSRSVRVADDAPLVLLDASLSMDTPGGQWRAALDTARQLAQTDGRILRFGAAPVPFDTLNPTAGRTQLGAALRVARAAGRPIIVVSDGEIEDIGSLGDAPLSGVRFVVLPRDTVLNAAIVSVSVVPRAQREDSIAIEVALAMWGALEERSARLEIFAGARRLAATNVTLPPAPSIARRVVWLRPSVLATGTHILRAHVAVSGDAEPRDDERSAVIAITELPAVVVLVDPADWEGRFLVTELSDIVQATVRGYARIAEDRWLDMKMLASVDGETVAGATRGAGLVVVRGGSPPLGTQGRSRAVWQWPAGSDARREFFIGDWYLSGMQPSSPLAGALARIEWDSLPPLSGLVPLVAGREEWVALTARQGRRGPERPILVGRDSAGVRTLTTAGAGLWRWAFRGGAAREAYRTLLAVGSDWLLGSQALRRRAPLTSSAVVGRGEPIVFRWAGDSVPDSLAVVLADERRRESGAILRFDREGAALVSRPPGTYRWSVSGADQLGGLAVVEQYSAEFAPRPVWTSPGEPASATRLRERYPRQLWWLFAFAVVAFAGEWAWRYRRGLP